MDPDEGLALAASAIISLAFVIRWYGGLIRVTTLGGGRAARWLLAMLPVACLAGLQFFLVQYAAHEVREDPRYDFLFLAGGGAWLALSTQAAKLAGLSARDDAIEARNPAALIALCGWWIGVMSCYCAANIGEGPTIWTTFVPAGAASLTLLILWIVFACLTRGWEAIVIDRDVASAWRLAGLLVGCGVVLGGAVAGDWHSWEGTWWDFLVQGWPVVVMFAVAAWLEIAWRPRPVRSDSPIVLCGIVPGLAFIAFGGIWVVLSRTALGMGGN